MFGLLDTLKHIETFYDMFQTLSLSLHVYIYSYLYIYNHLHMLIRMRIIKYFVHFFLHRFAGYL